RLELRERVSPEPGARYPKVLDRIGTPPPQYTFTTNRIPDKPVDKISYDLGNGRTPNRVHREAAARVSPGCLARLVARRAGADNGLPPRAGGPGRTRPALPRGPGRAASSPGRCLQSDRDPRACNAGALERCRADRRT